ncbi:MAG TPA: BTAD domain-containing putative transcriptional regulator [Gemmatimonadaceae bacterium]|nr:BTAD domain-containing putative transcriptional regulator [Gemmatimonadaceae bacterium]
MIELTLLGLHTVRDSDGRELGSLVAQPKRLALLAYLAIGGSAGYHRRDTLAAMFWPDLDQFAARRALRNTLYHLREAIGDGALISKGDEALTIDPAVLTCDVTRLSDAVAEGRYEEAVDLYRGELLAGVHFANEGEAFEEWLTRERARVLEIVVRAVRALVDRDEKAGDVTAAAYWAQRACTLAPDDEGFLRRAMSLHDAAGDRGGALRLYDSYARHASIHYETKPSGESAALAARIRDGAQRASPHAKISSTRSEPAPSTAAPVAPPVAPPSAPPTAPATAPPATSPPRTRYLARWILALGVAAAALVMIVRAVNASHAHPRSKERVLVDVFDNRTGDAKLEALGRMAEDWLSQGLLRTQLVDVVDPRVVFVHNQTGGAAAIDPVSLARKTGATLVVTGSYYRTPDSVLFQAAVTDARTGKIVRVVGPIGAGKDAPVAALDDLRSRVMTALASVVDLHGSHSMENGTEIPPFEAYESYVEGLDASWHGDRGRAEQLFLQASRRDPAFTDAAVAAASVASNYNECTVIDSIAHSLGAIARPLDRVQRLTLQIAVDRCHGRNEEMLRLTLERADLEPQTSSLRLSAIAAALWANRPHRALELLQHINPETDLAWSTDSSNFAYWNGIAEALHILGEHDAELASANRMPSVAPLTKAWLRGRALAALARPAETLALVDSALTLPTETSNSIGLAPFMNGRPEYSATPAWVAVWIARELATHGDSATSRLVAAKALAWYKSRPQAEHSVVEERLVAVWSLELMGAFADAQRSVRSLVAEDSANIDYRGMLGSIAAERGDTALADSVDRWLALQTSDDVSWSASYYRARNAALLGRRADAIARLREAADKGVWFTFVHVDPAFVTLHEMPEYRALIALKD